jgi:predicted transcriptional regulator
MKTVKAKKRRMRPKELVRAMLDRLPDDATLEDIQYRIYVCQKIQSGLDDIQAGRFCTQEEMEERMAQWLEV